MTDDKQRETLCPACGSELLYEPAGHGHHQPAYEFVQCSASCCEFYAECKEPGTLARLFHYGRVTDHDGPGQRD